MPYTGDDVRALIKVTSKLLNAISAVDLVVSEFATLDMDTGRVAEAIGALGVARTGLSNARSLIDDESNRIAGMIEYNIPSCDCICHLTGAPPHPDRRRCPHCEAMPNERHHPSEIRASDSSVFEDDGD